MPAKVHTVSGFLGSLCYAIVGLPYSEVIALFKVGMDELKITMRQAIEKSKILSKFQPMLSSNQYFFPSRSSHTELKDFDSKLKFQPDEPVRAFISARARLSSFA